MNSLEFKATLAEAFKAHMFMKERDNHTINELLWVLRHDSRFNGEDFNISIAMLDGPWRCIPCLDCFVDIKSLSVWFKDDVLEFEVEEFDDEKYNCITIYEYKKEA